MADKGKKKEDDEESAKGAEGESAAEGEEGKSVKGKKLIIIGLLLLFLIGGGVGLYFSGLLDGLLGSGEATEEHAEGEAPVEEESAESEHGEAAEGEGGEHGEAAGGEHGGGGTAGAAGESKVTQAGPNIFFYEMPEFLVNLQSESSKVHFLKMVVTLQLEDQESVQKVQAMQPVVQDSFQVYLRELRPNDLKGSAGIYRLREELLLRLNKSLQPIKVNDILFKEIIVQ